MELRERLDAELIRLVGEWDRKRAWEADGMLAGWSWLAYRTPTPPHEAQRLVRTARLVDAHPATAAALASGELTAGQVARLTRAMTDGRARLYPEHEAALLDAARSLRFDDFAKVVRRWSRLADDQLARDEHDEAFERRHLHASATFDGWGVGDFLLDPEGFARVVAALDELAPPDPVDAPDGVRTLPQRRADALVELAHRFLKGADPTRQALVTLNVVVDVATLNGDPVDVARTRCDIEGVGPVTRDTLGRLACGADLVRTVTAGPSVVLDMGRLTRLATPAQRRVLALRDGGCGFPGCSRPPHWCDAHHLWSWLAGGATDLDNLILLCRRHHVLVHEGRWAIVRRPTGQFEFRHPARSGDPPALAA